MPINFNPAVSFKSEIAAAASQKELKELSTAQKPDEFVKTSQPSQEEQVQQVNNCAVKEQVIADVPQDQSKEVTPVDYAKGYIDKKSKANPIAYSALKGAVQGAVIGAVFLGMSWIFNVLPKVSKKGPKLWDVIKHPLKHMDKSCKIISAVAAGLMIGYNILVKKLTIKAGLDSANNQNQQ